jgi:hypothetical protein
MVYNDRGSIERDSEFIIMFMVYSDRGHIQSEIVYNNVYGIWW